MCLIYWAVPQFYQFLKSPSLYPCYFSCWIRLDLFFVFLSYTMFESGLSGCHRANKQSNVESFFKERDCRRFWTKGSPAFEKRISCLSCKCPGTRRETKHTSQKVLGRRRVQRFAPRCFCNALPTGFSSSPSFSGWWALGKERPVRGSFPARRAPSSSGEVVQRGSVCVFCLSR